MASVSPELKALCQQIALEILIVDVLATRYLSTVDPVAAAKAHREHLRQVLSEVALPEFGDATMSELVIGEIGDAIDRHVETAGEMAARRLYEQGKRSE